MTVDARAVLGHRSADLEHLRARELTSLHQASLRLEVLEVLGPHPVRPPTVPNTWAAVGGRELLWLGPDEWLVVGEPGDAGVIAWLEEAFARLHRSIVDVSANHAVIEFHGDDRRNLLAAGCGLDLHQRSWRDGMCAQTLLGRVPVLLQERGDAMRVFVRA
ncbi:MAG: sarcosine oxidase subunit gamma, partial [Actinomycetota bacterium]